jgi:8-oxo-dGTP diphosphatase
MINVTAAILEKNNKILIARRPNGDSLAGYWEFPGGKIEIGETPEQCLEREISEELGLVKRVNKLFCESKYAYPNKCVALLAYFCELVSGEPKLNVHDRMEWVSYSQLGNYNFAPADIPIIEKLVRRGGWINETGICDHYCG